MAQQQEQQQPQAVAGVPRRARPALPRCRDAAGGRGAAHRRSHPPILIAHPARWLFVGQLPSDRGEADLTALFSPFGAVERVTMLRGPEGRSKGCAMVQFQRWAEAEAAMDGVNGTSPWEPPSKARPLVVHFANPRRAPTGQPSEPAITPRKLFVGQVRRAGWSVAHMPRHAARACAGKAAQPGCITVLL